MPSLKKLAPTTSNEAVISHHPLISVPFNCIPVNVHTFKQNFSILCSYYSTIMSHFLCCISTCCSMHPFPTLLNYFHLGGLFSSSPCHEGYRKIKSNMKKDRIQYHYLLFLFSSLIYPTKAS